MFFRIQKKAALKFRAPEFSKWVEIKTLSEFFSIFKLKA
jgi:hypothetical protein